MSIVHLYDLIGYRICQRIKFVAVLCLRRGFLTFLCFFKKILIIELCQALTRVESRSRRSRSSSKILEQLGGYLSTSAAKEVLQLRRDFLLFSGTQVISERDFLLKFPSQGVAHVLPGITHPLREIPKVRSRFTPTQRLTPGMAHSFVSSRWTAINCKTPFPSFSTFSPWSFLRHRVTMGSAA